MKKRNQILSIAAGAAGIVMLVSSPAMADVRVSGPLDCGTFDNQSCGYAQVRSNRTIVDACDTIADGAGFAASYQLANGTKGAVNDGNGSAAGCGIKAVGSASNPVVSIAPCKNESGTLLCSLPTKVTS